MTRSAAGEQPPPRSGEDGPLANRPTEAVAPAGERGSSATRPGRLTPSEEAGPATRHRRRVKLVDLEREASDPGFVKAHAVLEDYDGSTHEGRVELPDHAGNYIRAACRATLGALSKILGPSIELELIGVQTVRVRDNEIVLVQIGSLSEGRAKLLQGAAQASESPDLDAARAVMHATNRLVERVLRG